jgi:hypothetical protein
MSSEVTSPPNVASHYKARLVAGWLLFAVVVILNIIFCVGFCLLPAVLNRRFELRWDGWLFGFLLLGLPIPAWLSDRNAPSPLRASVVTLVAVALIFVPLFLLQCGVVLLGGDYQVPVAALSFLAWAEIAAIIILFLPFRGARVDVVSFLKGVVIVLYFVGLLLLAPLLMFSWAYGTPLLLLACLILPFLKPVGLFRKCSMGLTGLTIGAVLAFPLAILFPFARGGHHDFTPLVFGGILSPIGGITGLLLTRYWLKRRDAVRSPNPTDGSHAAAPGEGDARAAE